MADKSPQQNPFKVIIIGGSVAGLTLANALEKANIDYVLLEKRDVCPNVGQTIFVLPCTSLVLEQLGISSKLEEIAIPLRTREHWAGNGKDGGAKLFCSSDELWRLYQKANRPVRFVDRFRFLSGLYEGIIDKTKIHSREGLVSFTETEHGVTVRTDQGNTYEGSILVGADGVHSETRRQLSLGSQDEDPKRAKILSNGFITRYICLTALSPNEFADDPKRPYLAEGVVNNGYHEKEGLGTISCAGTRGQLIWSVYIPVEQTEYPSGRRYGQEDIAAFVEKYGHVRFCADYSIADVYKNVYGANMIAMEENVLPTKWHSSGRVVLVGDAVHKATANLGMGGNLCIDDVCRLVNGLVPILKENQAPSTEELVRVFNAYEKAAKPRALFVNKASGFFCGFETMTSWYAQLTKVIFPWIPSSLKMMVFSIFDGAAPRLSYLPVPAAKFQG